MLMLTMVSMGAWAQIDVQIANDGKFDGGTIKYVDQTKPDEKGFVTVTITVTPNKEKGYTIKKGDISVYSTLSPSGPSAGTRALEIADDLTLYFKGSADADTDDLSAERDYTFNVPSGFGAWVKEAKFQEKNRDGAKGTTPSGTDYSGIFYFVNCGSGKGGDPKMANINSPDDYFYLVPADNPQQDNKRDAWFSSDYSTANGDPEKPYLTTYKTKKDAAEVPQGVTNRPHNSVWIVKFVSTDSGTDYYNLIHAATGKYVVYEPPYPGKNNRKSVHLLTTDSPGENAKFAITINSSNYNFRPKSLTSGNRFFNTAQQNYNFYYSSDATAEGDANYFRGLVGLWSAVGDASDWKPEATLLPAPTISYDSDTNKFTIIYNQLPTGYTILYTIDGTEPTIGGTTISTYDGSPVSVTGSYTVKAVVARYGLVLTELASQAVGKPASPIVNSPTDCSNLVSLTADDGVNVYYTLDGTDPDNNSIPYLSPFALDETATIKAVAYNGNLKSDITTDNYVPLYTTKPTITRTGITITMAGNGSIYYTTDGSDPTTNSTPYTGPITLESGEGDVTYRAIAKADGKGESCISEITVSLGYFISSVSDLNNISSHLNGMCIITDDFDASGFTTSISGFTGVLDGDYHKISNLSKPLFASTDGAIIRNITFESLSINVTGNVGAITGEAMGNTRIYNCGVLSGSVKGSNKVGSIVGSLEGSSRVINCYSYATVGGGNDVGGIVGYNNIASTASNIQTMVMNCMFYGDITSGSNISPVYGGEIIDNLQGGLNNFNYYAYTQLTTAAINKYNNALAVEDKYLNRFEYYRLLLNSNKKLAAFYATGSPDNSNEMAKWVLETADRTNNNPKPYPVLKAQGYYPSIINIDADHAEQLTLVNGKPNESDRNQGGKIGTLSITISTSKTNGGQSWPTGAGITTTSLPAVVRTDMDEGRYNFNYDKVQLPYYNDVGIGNYTGNRVVTGWKIVAIAGGKTGTYKAADEWGGYNFADRNCTNKDLYSVSGRIFSQGAYFDVPYGVTSITIEPYWAKAAYISDPNYDVVYKSDYLGKQNVTQTGTQVTVGTTMFDGEKFGTTSQLGTAGQIIQTSIANALNYISNSLGGYGPTVYDNAVVLVGNFHQNDVPSNDINPFTLISVDIDNDHEPDNSLIYHHTGKKRVCPIRFDFLNIPGTAQAQKPNGANLICNMAIIHPSAWFEITNTSSIYFSQLEYEDLVDNPDRTEGPLILQGGVLDQFVSTNNSAVNGKTIYMHLGGNVWFKEFNMGTHSDGSNSTPHPPVSVTGGEYDGFYLTGTYNQDAAVRTDNAECYISGGHFIEAAGTGQEAIDGDVHWQIYNTYMNNFYGGGTNGAAGKNIKGNVTVDIFNSHVGTFCGGPKFGNMESGKIVTTNADGCVFGKFFGAGYGGTSYSRKKYYDKDDNPVNWDTQQGKYTTDRGKYFDGSNASGNGLGANNKYGYKGIGVATDFDYEYFVWSTGTTGGRFFVKFASFSLAQCNNVSSTLKNCTVETNFYGGGNLGKVVGTATSVLEDCTVKGSVYGAGYSASLPTVEVRDAGFTTNPNYNSQSGMFEPGVFSGTTTFTWQNAAAAGKTLTNGNLGSDLTNHILYTDIELTGLGEVAHTDLTITGTTTVAGSVYGGGEESNVSGNTNVNICAKDENGAYVAVSGNPIISGNVYGGGKGVILDAGEGSFECAKAMVGIDGAGADAVNYPNYSDGNTHVRIGNGTVGTLDGNNKLVAGTGNVYGGGQVGRVEKNTEVTIGFGTGVLTGSPSSKPVIEGSVFGAGAGVKTHGYSALVRGNSTVTVQGNAWVKKSVYGGGEIASVGRYNVVDGLPTTPISGGECFVNILGCAEIGPNGMLMTADGGPDDAGHVFGAGKGVLPYEGYKDNEKPQHMDGRKEDNKWVDDPKSYTAYESLGGNEDANYSKFLHTLALASETHVTIDGNAFIKGSVYGGGENGFVQANTYVTIAGGQIGCGKNTTERYSDDVWAPGYVPTTDLECASWTFGDGKPYDKYAGAAGYNAKEGALVATDGHTFYGNVFAGGSGYYPYRPGKWFQSAGRVNGNTNLTITGGHILTNVYGGNEMTDVVGSCTISMSGGTVGVPRTYEQMRAHPVTCYIFGAGKGDPRVFFNTWTNVGSTQVNISGSARIYGSTFGGGEDGHVLGDAETNINTGSDVPVGTGESASTLRYPYIGTTGTSAVDGNIFGGGRGYSENALTAGVVCGNVRVNIHDGTILGSIFGGGRLASVGTHLAAADNTDYYGTMIPDGKQQVIGGEDVDDTSDNPVTHGHITITIDGGSIGAVDNAGKLVNSNYTIGDVFGGSKGSSTDKRFGFAKSTSVTISEPNAKIPTRINRSVFGGGEAGNVEGDVTVTLNGGIVGEDLYGGGALADTNIGSFSVDNFEEATVVTGETVVTGMYTKTGNTYTLIVDAEAKAAEGIMYYTKTTLSDQHAQTTVNLYGGKIMGDAFGGGLGQKTGFNGGTSDIPATTYGDITITLGKEDKSSATAFNVTYENTDQKDENNQFIQVVKSGRLFGTNNLNGSPQGNVTVNVYNTVAGNVSRTAADPENPGRANRSTDVEHKYEVAAVYGGGNLANYSATGKKASVTIHTCNVSVQHVYGGGNAAAVPETDVLVKGAYEIEHVFGGGNGKDKYKKGNEWILNAGADVSTNTNTLLIGGYIHEAYGGSNEKGTIGGNVTINTNSEHEDCACDLELVKLYGAGKNADIDGDLIVVLDCAPETKTEEIYGGAENANVRGNVELTITSGTFGKVFGGNNQSGAIFGHIILNIEETSCRPIIIDELYGCGNNAAYSVYGYKNGTDAEGDQIYVPRTSVNDGTAVTFNKDENQTAHTTPNPQYDDPEVNIISCTRIGKVFGGGLGSGAIVYGNPTVNIDQIPGAFATQIDRDGNGVADNNSNALGEIGDVFGGGNEANVVGNTNVNIGTKDKVWLHQSVDDTGTYTMSPALTEPGISVVGANITGNVYGGGNEAEVTGNTNVTIGKQSVTP